MSTTGSAEDLAAQFEATLARAIANAEALPLEAWYTVAPADGRPVNVILYHVAVAFSFQRRVLRAVLAGDYQPFTPEWVEAANAEGDAAHRDAEPTEVIDQLRGRGASMADAIRALSPEDLALEFVFEVGTPRRSVAQIVVDEVIGHVEGHLAAVQAIAA